MQQAIYISIAFPPQLSLQCQRSSAHNASEKKMKESMIRIDEVYYLNPVEHAWYVMLHLETKQIIRKCKMLIGVKLRRAESRHRRGEARRIQGLPVVIV